MTMRYGHEDDDDDNDDYIQILVINKKAGEVEEYAFIITTIFFAFWSYNFMLTLSAYRSCKQQIFM